MYYAKSVPDAWPYGKSLGVLEPTGMTCMEVKRIYEREVRLSKTRSKSAHRKRAKKNAQKFEPAFNECKSLSPEAVAPSAGGLPDPLTLLATTPLFKDGTPQEPVNYAKVFAVLVGGVALAGGAIWAIRSWRRRK